MEAVPQTGTSAAELRMVESEEEEAQSPVAATEGAGERAKSHCARAGRMRCWQESTVAEPRRLATRMCVIALGWWAGEGLGERGGLKPTAMAAAQMVGGSARVVVAALLML